MISIDTNVLIRYLVRDDAEQAQAARVLLQGLNADNQGFVSREVVVEVVWVLERAYGFTRSQIADVLSELTTTEGLVMESSDDVAQAAYVYGQGGADFADLMILAAAHRVGATPLHTFDRRLSRLDGAALVGG